MWWTLDWTVQHGMSFRNLKNRQNRTIYILLLCWAYVKTALVMVLNALKNMEKRIRTENVYNSLGGDQIQCGYSEMCIKY